MRFPTSTTLLATALISTTVASYAPVPTSCPSMSLVREATGLSDEEADYQFERKQKADGALFEWLVKTNPAFDPPCDMPTLGLTSSGGGFRALLIGAGVIQALDGRDSNIWSTLLQSWEPAFANGLFNPNGNSAVGFAQINTDLAAKTAAGFSSTMSDAWSRLLSYQLLPGENGGVSNTLSQIASVSNFVQHNTPYSIIIAQNVDSTGTSCLPPQNASMWEFTPYEFGSWDTEVMAFAPTSILGSSLSGGVQVFGDACITNYDNLGFVLGTSSMLFNDPVISDVGASPPQLVNQCATTVAATGTTDPLATLLSNNVAGLLAEIPSITFKSVADLFATWPNPFYIVPSAPGVSAQKNLALVDGGESGQVNPIFPMLLPARNIDVILVNDNDADTSTLYPNGYEPRNSYEAAQLVGLTRMPFIPTSDVLVARNLTSAPVFFGCNSTEVATIVWIPDAPLTAAGGNVSTSQMQFEVEKTRSMVNNGVVVMSQGDSKEWATCLGCAILENADTALPDECQACFEKYCFAQ